RRGAHDDFRAVPMDADRDGTGCSVQGDERQPGQVTGQQLLAVRAGEYVVDRLLIHEFPSGCLRRIRSAFRVGTHPSTGTVRAVRPAIDPATSADVGGGEDAGNQAVQVE